MRTHLYYPLLHVRELVVELPLLIHLLFRLNFILELLHVNFYQFEGFLRLLLFFSDHLDCLLVLRLLRIPNFLIYLVPVFALSNGLAKLCQIRLVLFFHSALIKAHNSIDTEYQKLSDVVDRVRQEVDLAFLKSNQNLASKLG